LFLSSISFHVLYFSVIANFILFGSQHKHFL
jgi:hypothetical protein